MEITPINPMSVFDEYGDVLNRGINLNGYNNNNLGMNYDSGLSTNFGQGISPMDTLSQYFKGNASLRDFGSVASNSIQESPLYQSGKDIYQKNHGDLSAKNQFGNIWGGLQALTGLYGAFKQSRMADKQYGMQKDMWNKSWDANRKSVNESVDLRAANRFNERPEERAAHVKKYSI